jgi:hypothetical protein
MSKYGFRASRVALLTAMVLASALAGCGGGGTPVGDHSVSGAGQAGGWPPPSPPPPLPPAPRPVPPGEDEPEDDFAPPFEEADAQGRLLLPAGVLASSVRGIASILGTVPVDAGGAFTELPVPAGRGGLLVLLVDAGGAVLAPAHLDGPDLDIADVARGFVLLTQRGLVVPSPIRAQFLAFVTSSGAFRALVDEIASLATGSPTLLDLAQDRLLLELAHHAAIQGWAALQAASPPSAVVKGTVGDPRAIAIEGEGWRVDALNGTLLYYGLEVSDGASVRSYLLHPRAGLHELLWGLSPVVPTPPSRHPLGLSAPGTYAAVAFRGLARDVPGWTDAGTAAGAASWANVFLAAGILFDTMIPPDSAADGLFAGGGLLETVLARIADTTAEGDAILVSLASLRVESPHVLPADLLRFLARHWTPLHAWIWERWPSVVTPSFLEEAARVVEVLAAVAPIVDASGVGGATTYVPFFHDLAVLPSRVEVCFDLTALGELIPTCGHVAPSPAFRWAPDLPQVGDLVIFDSETVDDDVPSLRFRWDFDGDGVWDADFQGVPFTTHVYAVPGIHEVTLEVTDRDLDRVLRRVAIVVGPLPLPPPPPPPAPDAFVLVEAVAICGATGPAVRLVWSQDAAATHYQVYRDLQPYGPVLDASILGVDLDLDLSLGASRSYFVVAFDGAGHRTTPAVDVHVPVGVCPP